MCSSNVHDHPPYEDDTTAQLRDLGITFGEVKVEELYHSAAPTTEIIECFNCGQDITIFPVPFHENRRDPIHWTCRKECHCIKNYIFHLVGDPGCEFGTDWKRRD